jgi:hypothetical protein
MNTEKPNWPQTPSRLAAQLRGAAETLSALAAPTEQFAARIQFIADLLADRPDLPQAALLVWRGADRSVRRAAIGAELVVGRQAGANGLSIAEDKLLSRRHFRISPAGAWFVLEDLKSHNGTAINRRANPVQLHRLHDGDLILAGNQIFAFLAPEVPNTSPQAMGKD